jgi:flagellar biosynthesis protein FliQ
MGGEEAIYALVGVVLVICLAALIVLIFFLISLQKALTLAGEENREMSPGLVWLNLIPIFNLGWMVYTVLKVSEAISKKHTAHNVPNPTEGAKTTGLVYSICSICSIIPIIGGLIALVGLVFFIIYWVNIAGFNKTMPQMA